MKSLVYNCNFTHSTNCINILCHSHSNDTILQLVSRHNRLHTALFIATKRVQQPARVLKGRCDVRASSCYLRAIWQARHLTIMKQPQGSWDGEYFFRNSRWCMKEERNIKMSVYYLYNARDIWNENELNIASRKKTTKSTDPTSVLLQLVLPKLCVADVSRSAKH